MATAEAVIKRRCGDEDSYSRAGDTSFLICFGALSEREAAFRAAVIGREVRDRLIGHGDDPEFAHVRAIAAEVRFPDHGETAASLHAILLGGLETQLARLEQEARKTLQTALSGTSCELRRVIGRDANATLAMQVRLPADLERSVISALAALPKEETRTFDLDGLLLGLAAQNAMNAMAKGNATFFMANVRFDAFATRGSTERFVATCRMIDERVAGRLILLLSGMPPGLPKSRQLECINRLRPYCHGVGYQVEAIADLTSIDLSFSAEPIVSMPARLLTADGPEKLMALFSALHARRARILIREVPSKQIAASFLTIGADLIAMT
jgi:hypothetical protein